MGKLAMSAEDHLKTIFALDLEEGQTTSRAVAVRLGISPPSVAEAVKRLRRDGLVEPAGGSGLKLTDSGRQRALDVVRRHRIIETFLHRILRFELHELHREADLIEHVISPPVLERLDVLLGHPDHDPHGDPIPREGRPHDEAWPPSLASVPEGSELVVERVLDHDAEVLQRLVAEGIVPGTRLAVGAQDPFGGGREVMVDGRRLQLAPRLVEAVHGYVLAPQVAS